MIFNIMVLISVLYFVISALYVGWIVLTQKYYTLNELIVSFLISPFVMGVICVYNVKKYIRIHYSR
jgi:hypothetical protein